MKRHLKNVVRKILPAGSLVRHCSTSLSHNQEYPQVCLDAAGNYRLFNNFRRHPAYNQILEHVDEARGAKLLEVIFNYPTVVAAMEAFKANDLYGNPRMYDYEKVGTISPTTLRYVKVLCDLGEHFKTVNDFDICEIGVGYGGQCRVINAFYKPASYFLVDIQPALALAQRFLENYALKSAVIYATMNELRARDYDLVISNYAFTELTREVQDAYLEKVILRSKRGYITGNEITPPSFNSYKPKELAALIKGSKLSKEIPLTHPKNYILTWGQ